MKFLTYCAMFIGLIMMTQSCPSKHLIGDAAERAAVQGDFDKRVATLNQGNLFEVFNQPMTEIQKEAMTFLYAYMPLGDITDYSGEYFLENID